VILFNIQAFSKIRTDQLFSEAFLFHSSSLDHPYSSQ